MKKKMKGAFAHRTVISLGTLIIVGIHIFVPEARIDSITVFLLLIAAVPWASPVLKSIELLGVKLELKDLGNRTSEALGAAESAIRQAKLALANSTDDEAKSDRTKEKTLGSVEIRSLAKEYDHIRETQPSGDARTAAMTGIIRRMIELSSKVGEFDINAALQEASAGMRLFAYSFLYSQPDSRWLPLLVNTVTTGEDHPFNQYWGLQAIGRMISQDNPALLYDIRSNLRGFLEKVPRGTDRDYEVRSLIRQIDQILGAN